VEEEAESRDAESRVCAVRALGAVACKLCAVGGEAPQLRARQLLPRVYDALLMAMDDYSTDSRCVATRSARVHDASTIHAGYQLTHNLAYLVLNYITHRA